MIMDGIKVKVVRGQIMPSKGSAGFRTHVPGGMATVSNLASATGGMCSATSHATRASLVQSDNK